MAKDTIKRNELIEDDIFSNVAQSAEQAEARVKALATSLKVVSETASSVKNSGSKDIPKTTADIESLNAKFAEANALLVTRQKIDKDLQKERIKLQELQKEQVQLLRQEVALEKEEIGTLERLKIENQQLRKEREKLNLTTEEGVKRMKEINVQLDRNNTIIKESADNQKKQTLNVGNYEGAVKSLRTELRELTQALANMDQSDPRWQEMANRAGEIRDTMGDTRAVIEATAGSAVENMSGAFARTGQIGVAAFQGVESALALVGVENENVMRTMMRLQALAGLGDALKELGGLGDKLTEIQAGFTAAAQKMGWFTKATVAQEVATKGASKASQVLSVSMKAIPLVALAAGIIALVANFDKVKRAITGVSKEQEAYNEVQDMAIEAAAEELSALDRLRVTINDETISREDKNKAVKDLQEQYPDLLANVDAEKIGLEELNKVLILSAQLVTLKAQAEALASLRADEYKKIIQEQAKLQSGQNAGYLDYIKAVTMGGNAQAHANLSSAKAIKNGKDQVKVYDDLDKALQGSIDNLEKQLGLDDEAVEKRKKADDARKKADEARKKAEQDRAKAEQDRAKAEEEALAIQIEKIDALAEGLEREKKLREDIANTTRDILNMQTDVAPEVEPEDVLGVKAFEKGYQQLEVDLLKSTKSREQIQQELLQFEVEALEKRVQMLRDFGITDLALEKDLAEKKRQLQETSSKAQFDTMNKAIETSTDLFIKNADARIAKIDEEMAMYQKQADLYRDLAQQGSVTAQQSLAEQDRLIAESTLRRQQEERKKQQVLMVSGILQAYNSNLSAGDNSTVAFTKAITSSEVLKQFIAALPAFLEGTDNTGVNGAGIDGKGGFLSVLHPNERVMPSHLNNKIGDYTNEEVAHIMENHRIGKLVDGSQVGGAWQSAALVNSFMKLEGKMSAIEKAIIEKPETNIELGAITQKTMEIVHTTRTPKLITKRIHKITRP